MIKEKNIKNSVKLAELQALSFEQIRKLNREQLGNLIYDLNRNHGLSFREIEKLTGMAPSTLQHLASGGVKKDKSNVLARKVFNGNFDYDLLIEKFRLYRPRSNEEREKMKLLAVVLMDCARR